MKPFGEFFVPTQHRKRAHAEIENQRFVHYASAEAAIKIYQLQVHLDAQDLLHERFHGGKTWPRLLRGRVQLERGRSVQNTLDAAFPGITPKVERLFDLFKKDVETGTYVTSFSVHDAAEDSYGRLSMWRAYGNPTGVALVLKHHLFTAPLDALSVYEPDDQQQR